MTHLPARALLALLINAAIYGVSWWPFRELDASGLHALWANAVVFATLTILVILLWPALPAQLIRRPDLWLLGLAAGLTNASFNWGLVIGEVVQVVLLFYLMPVWAALMGRWLLAESLSLGVCARVGCALAGAAVILYEPGSGLPVPDTGAEWLGLAGGIFFAANNVLLRRHRPDSPQLLALATFLGGFAVPGLLALALSIGGTVAWPSPVMNWALVAIGLTVALAVGNIMLIYGAARVAANITSTVLITEIVFAAVTAYLFAGEHIGWQTLTGGLLIVGASVAAAFSTRRPVSALQ